MQRILDHHDKNYQVKALKIIKLKLSKVFLNVAISPQKIKEKLFGCLKKKKSPAYLLWKADTDGLAVRNSLIREAACVWHHVTVASTHTYALV